jgi:hypothetical protein
MSENNKICLKAKALKVGTNYNQFVNTFLQSKNLITMIPFLSYYLLTLTVVLGKYVTMELEEIHQRELKKHVLIQLR